MERRVLDTSVLIGFWKAESLGRLPAARVRAKAQELIALHKTDAIVTPVYVEMVAGTRSKAELEQARAFLGEFKVIDRWDVKNADWAEARRLAERVPANGRRRHLGDCLVEAIADRLNHEVFAIDTYF